MQMAVIRLFMDEFILSGKLNMTSPKWQNLYEKGIQFEKQSLLLSLCIWVCVVFYSLKCDVITIIMLPYQYKRANHEMWHPLSSCILSLPLLAFNTLYFVWVLAHEHNHSYLSCKYVTSTPNNTQSIQFHIWAILLDDSPF